MFQYAWYIPSLWWLNATAYAVSKTHMHLPNPVSELAHANKAIIINEVLRWSICMPVSEENSYDILVYTYHNSGS